MYFKLEISLKKYFFFAVTLITSAIDCFLSKTGRIYIHFDLGAQFIKTSVVYHRHSFFHSFRSGVFVDFNWFYKIRSKNRWLCDIKINQFSSRNGKSSKRTVQKNWNNKNLAWE